MLLSAIGPILSYSYELINTSSLRYAEFEPSSNWVLNHRLMEEVRILSDQPTIEKYFLEVTKDGKYFKRVYIDSLAYNSIVNPSNETTELDKIADFAVLNMKFNRIDTLDWKQYQPFNKYKNEINNNTNINKIYDDEAVWIMQT